jgi:hypothetical protein
MLKFKVTFELEEEQLRDLFEANDIKFTKKKAKEIQKAIDENFDYIVVLEEAFSEMIDEIITQEFGE